MRIAQIAAVVGLVFLCGPASAADVAPETSARTIQAFYDSLIDSMKQSRQLGITGRYNKLKPAVEETFDIAAMTQMAVGPKWSTISAADQKALVQAFERMTIANYARNFDSYNGERFVVDPKVVTRGEERLVQSRLEVPHDQAVPFIYRMHQSGGSWKVVDVYLNGFVSELATRRSDFSTTLASSGSAGLVKQLNSLSDKLMAGG
jgi:phospholipid transport system substrate-binding protein